MLFRSVIRYRADGAFRIYEGGDQIWWQAIYADRPGPLQAGAVTIHLPSDVRADQVKLAGYPSNAVQEARLVDPRTAFFTTGALASGHGFEVRLQIPHGMVNASPPPWQEAFDRQVERDAALRPVLNIIALLQIGRAHV